MSGDLESARGTLEWAIAIVCASLAKGGRTSSRPPVADLAVAAETLLISFREIGHDHLITDEGVWALAWLEDGELVPFALAAVRGWLERSNLELRWTDGGEA